MRIDELSKYNFVGSSIKEIIVLDCQIKLIIDFYDWEEEDCFVNSSKEANKLTLTFPQASCNMETIKFNRSDILAVKYQSKDDAIIMYMAYYSEFMDDFDEIEIHGEQVICEMDNN